jgi:hypothetical protein
VRLGFSVHVCGVRETSLRSAEVLHSSLARAGCFRSSPDAELGSAEVIEA